MQHKLRIGLLTRGQHVPAWQHALLAEIVASSTASIVVRIDVDGQSRSSLARSFEDALLSTFKWRERNRSVVHDACKMQDVDSLLSGVDLIRLPDHGRYISDLSEFELDLIFALTDIPSLGELLDACRLGILFYSHDELPMIRRDTSAVGFSEFLARRPYLHSSLRMRSRDFVSTRTIYESFTSIDAFSLTTTRNEHLWKIRAFVPRVLREISKHTGHRYIEALGRQDPALHVDNEARFRNPSFLGTLRSLMIYGWWRIATKVNSMLYDEKWILLFRLGERSFNFSLYTKMMPPSGLFWADPFVVCERGCYFVFFEEADVATGKGHISLIEMNEAGEYGESRTVLERPYHLSYPFVFDWHDDRFMLVESAENQTVELYRCQDFPAKWELEKVLINGIDAYDATLLKHDDRWWMFANVREHSGASSWDELCIFFADNPLSSNWHPHPMNPVVSDVRNARPAGRIFERNGRLFRPSQNSSYRYGYGLNINEILILSETKYEEQAVEHYEPRFDRSIRAVHTINSEGSLTLIDAIHRKSTFAN